MSADLVQLPQRDTSVHGRRYTDDERAGWYLYWRIIAGRSCRKVAQHFHVDERTIRAARDDDNWIARANDEDTDDYASSRHGVAAIVVTELVPSIEKMRWLRENAKDEKVQADAAKWLAGLAGVSPVSKIEQAVTDRREQVIEAPPDFASMTPDELRAYDESIRKTSKRQTAVATDRTRP